MRTFGVDQIVRFAAAGNRRLHVVQHHVGVVDGLLRTLGEAVAVIPLAHHRQRLVDVLVEHAVVAVALQDGAHLCGGEAKHLVELRHQADVGADVEAAGHVVHGDRRHAGNEHALHAAAVPGARLEGGEEVAVEAAAVGKRLVRRRPAVGEDGIGEVVVLVDQHVQRDAVLRSVSEQIVQFAVDSGMGEDAIDHRLREQILIILQRIAARRSSGARASAGVAAQPSAT